MPEKRKQRALFAQIDSALRKAYEELLPHLTDKQTGKPYAEIIPPDAYFYFRLSWNEEFSHWSKQQAERVAPQRGLRPYCILFQTPEDLRGFFQQVEWVRSARFWTAFRYDPDYRQDFENLVSQFPQYKEIEQNFFEGNIGKAQKFLTKATPPLRESLKELLERWQLRWLPDPSRTPGQLLQKGHSWATLSARPRGAHIMAFYRGVSSEDERILKKANFVIPVFAETTEDDVINAYRIGRFWGGATKLAGIATA